MVWQGAAVWWLQPESAVVEADDKEYHGRWRGNRHALGARARRRNCRCNVVRRGAVDMLDTGRYSVSARRILSTEQANAPLPRVTASFSRGLSTALVRTTRPWSSRTMA